MTQPHHSSRCVLAPVLAPLFATLPPARSSRSHGLPANLWDGTDPLLGGQAGAPGAAGLRPAHQRQEVRHEPA
jgi:hypothetical protein